MRKQLLVTGLAALASGYRASRELGWYVSRRLQRA